MRATVGDLLGRPLGGAEERNDPGTLYCSGPMGIPLPGPRVAVVGSRDASARGLGRAAEVACALARAGIVTVSGLARGADSAAHRAAMGCGGRTIAVLGTPLGRAYPAENRELQAEIARDHLVVSQYPPGHRTAPRDFALRNLTMALLSDAAVVAEARDGGGALHLAREMRRLGRPLLAPAGVAGDPGLAWPGALGAAPFGSPGDVPGMI